MELKEQFTGFFEAIQDDNRITPVHISLYMGLLAVFLVHPDENPFQIERDKLMQFAKVSARSTYYKSLRELHDFGYIRYTPSYNLYLGSLVFIKRI